MRLRLLFTAVCGVTALSVTTPAAPRIDTKTAVRLAREYVAEWQRSLAAVVTEERYRQTLDEWPLGRHVASLKNTRTLRTLVSDVLLVHAPRDQTWLMFRDVLSVDGQAVHDRQRRFDNLFVRPDVNLVANARSIAEESARFNVGRLHRNVNTPVATLAFLDERYATSVRWRDVRPADVDGVTAWELPFEQKRDPFVIRTTDGKSQRAHGRLWIEPGSGRIVRTELEINAPLVSLSPRGRTAMSRTWSRVISRFGPAAGLDIWVPIRMTDEYEVYARFEERMVGEAVYTNHRLFQTSARIVGGGAQ